MTCTYSVDTFLLEIHSVHSVFRVTNLPGAAMFSKMQLAASPSAKLEINLLSLLRVDLMNVNIQYLQGQRAQLQLQGVFKKGLSVFWAQIKK